MSIKVFFCYAREDEPLLEKLKSHLRPLQRKGFIDVWYDRNIGAGTEWEREIDKQLDMAQIVLLLVSPDFIDSDYCYSIEMKHALERHERGEAWVIPIILRQSYWQEEPFGKLQVLPTDGRPVRSWPDLDEAFFNVTDGIRKTVKEQFIKQGCAYYEAGQYREALTAIKQSIQIDHHNAQQYKSMGDALSKLGENEEAVNAFERAITLNPKYAIAYNNMAWALNELKRHEEALKACDIAIGLDPNYAPAYRNKGQALYECKNYEEAIKSYNRAILLDPNSSNVYENKGHVLLLLKRYEEALSVYEQAIRLDPHNAKLHNTIATIFRELKRHKEALAAFEEAIRLDPNLIQAYEGKIAVLRNLTRDEESLEVLRKARQIKDTLFLVEVLIESVRINPDTQQRVVILKEKEQERYLFIWVAHEGAYNIAVELQGVVSPKPLPLDLFKNLLDGLEVSVTMAIISDLIDDVFHARLRIKIADKEIEFDARPSDAIALALYSKAPIYVEKHVLEKAGVALENKEESTG